MLCGEGEVSSSFGCSVVSGVILPDCFGGCVGLVFILLRVGVVGSSGLLEVTLRLGC